MTRYIHNTTFIVERSVAAEFTTWAKNVYIKAARESNRFESVTMARILAEIAPDTINYAVQMTSNSLEESAKWHNDVATLLKDDIAARLGAQKVMFFSTDMEVVE